MTFFEKNQNVNLLTVKQFIVILITEKQMYTIKKNGNNKEKTIENKRNRGGNKSYEK